MATILAQAVTFKSLLAQLSKHEFLTFMSRMFDKHQTELISTALFQYFMHSSITNPDSPHVTNINSTLSSIIQSRKEKPKPLAIADIKLDKLPKALIGHCASFLDQWDYLDFEQTNRAIFIGCNSPNMLTRLDLTAITNYSLINLKKFKSLKRLEINLSKFNELSLPQNGQSIMNELTELFLCGNEMTDFDIESFISQKCINIHNLKSLQFENFGLPMHNSLFSTDKFWRLLTHFKNVHYLGFSGVCLNSAVLIPERMTALCALHPSLKGLHVNGGNVDVNDDLVNIFGNNLQLLAHCSQSRNGFSSINFSKLEQIALLAPSVTMINDILKTGHNIRQLFLNSTARDIMSESAKEIIPKIFKCKLLQHLCVCLTNDNCLSVLDGIENGLFQTKTWERKQLRIKIAAAPNTEIDLKSIMYKISHIILLLESSKVNDFMFICDMNGMNDEYAKKFDTNGMLKELNDISANVKVKAKELCFIVTNTNCRICVCEWFERWKMNFW